MSRAIVGTVLAACLCSLLHAQSAVNDLKFEVASVKPAAPPAGGVIRPGPQGGPGSADPARLTYSFSTLRDLLVDAYSVKRSQISGAPNWLDSVRFDIVAKVPEGATKEQAKVMLQNLLAERFKLTLHRETKELPVYALVVAKNGPRLEVSKGDNAQRGIHGQRGSMTCTGVSMETLTKWGLAPRLATSCSIRPA